MQNVNFIIVGDPFVGKTSIVSRFASNQFYTVYSPTIRIEFDAKRYGDIRIQIWDASGHDMYISSMRLYCRRSDVAICVYSENVQEWLSEIIANASKDILIAIVLTKKDDVIFSSSIREEARNFAQKHQCLYFEVSALTGSGIDTMFESCADTILTRREILDRVRAKRPSPLVIESQESLIEKPVACCCLL